MKQTERYGALDGTKFISKRLTGLIAREEMKAVFTISCPSLSHFSFTGNGVADQTRPLRPQCNHLPIVMIEVREEMQDKMDAPFSLTPTMALKWRI